MEEWRMEVNYRPVISDSFFESRIAYISVFNSLKDKIKGSKDASQASAEIDG